MRYHIQETIFPDRHTVSVMNPQTGDFLPVAEVRDMLFTSNWTYDEWNRPGAEGQFRTVNATGGTRDGLHSASGETLEEFAAMVAKFYSPFERLRPSDYTGNLFDS